MTVTVTTEISIPSMKIWSVCEFGLIRHEIKDQRVKLLFQFSLKGMGWFRLKHTLARIREMEKKKILLILKWTLQPCQKEILAHPSKWTLHFNVNTKPLNLTYLERKEAHQWLKKKILRCIFLLNVGCNDIIKPLWEWI